VDGNNLETLEENDCNSTKFCDIHRVFIGIGGCSSPEEIIRDYILNLTDDREDALRELDKHGIATGEELKELKELEDENKWRQSSIYKGYI